MKSTRGKSKRQLSLRQTANKPSRTLPALPRIPWQSSWFERGGDFALCGIIFVAPLIMGGRHELGKLVYLGFVALLTACWLGENALSPRPHWRRSSVEWLLLAGLMVLILQLIHWPAWVLAYLSPFQSQLLTHWSPDLQHSLALATWDQVSLTPYATWLGLGVYLAHAMLFLILVQKFQDIERIKQLLQWLALAALGMAALGLLQFVSGTERYAWLFEHPSRPANHGVTGPYSNSNHFTHFLALGIGPLIWWLQGFNHKVVAGPTGNTFGGKKSHTHWFTTAAAIALTVVALAGLLAKSRGGMIVMFLATLSSVSLYVRMKLITPRSWYLLCGIAVLLLAALALHGYQSVQDELATITAGSLDSIDEAGARRKIWHANLEAAQKFPILGAGVGSHKEIYPRFFPYFSNVEFTHAESGYLQVLTETGIVGLGLLLMGWCYCGYWSLRSLRSSSDEVRAFAVAIMAGLLVSATHSIFDFPWYIPSCMSVAVMLAAAMYSLSQTPDVASTRRETYVTHNSTATAWPAMAVIGLLLLVAAANMFIGPAIASGHWTRYRRLSLQSKRDMHRWLITSTNTAERSQKLAISLYDNSRRMASHLERVLDHDPHHPRANRRMAEVQLRLFEFSQKESQNAMGLPQIRDAAVASRFSSRQDLDEWLARAVGEPREWLSRALHHVTQSLRICPLQGRSYLYASDLAFLRGIGTEGSRELIRAAARVRPHDASVLFTIGREIVFSGNVEGALGYWKKSFHLSREYREAIINTLAGQMPAPLFVDYFEPDQEGIESLLRFYRDHQLTAEAQVVAPIVLSNLAEQSQHKSGLAAAHLWHRSRDIHRYLGDLSQALTCARSAVRLAPNWFEGRRALADELFTQKSYEASLNEYRWCARRRPFDKKLRNQMETVESLLIQDASPVKVANFGEVKHR